MSRRDLIWNVFDYSEAAKRYAGVRAHTEGPYDQEGFIWRADDGSEASGGATFLQNVNTDISVGDTGADVDLDTNVRLRLVIANTGDASSGNGQLQSLEYDVDTGGGYSGSWTAVTTTSSYVRKSTFGTGSGQPTDEDATTNQANAGTGVWSGFSPTGTFFSQADDSGSGSVCDDNGNPNSKGEIGAGGYVESEFCLTFRSADLSNGDKVKVRFTNDSGATLSYTSTPEITVSDSGAGPTTANRLTLLGVG